MKVFITGNYPDVTFLTNYFKRYTNIEVLIQENKQLEYKNIGFFKNLLIADIIHIISIKSNGLSGIFWIVIFLCTKFLNKKVILHWQGTDVSELSKLNGVILSKLLSYQTAQATWLCTELKEKNVIAHWNPIVPPLPKECFPYPSIFTVLVYLGVAKNREKFYGAEILEELAEIFKKTKFFVVGNRVNSKLSNIHNFGFFNYRLIDEVYSEVTVLLRFPKHDGLSFMVLEALGRGRHVIWNQKFPHCLYVKSLNEIITLLKKISNNKLEFNREGQKYVETNFGPRKCINSIVQVYRGLMNDF